MKPSLPTRRRSAARAAEQRGRQADDQDYDQRRLGHDEPRARERAARPRDRAPARRRRAAARASGKHRPGVGLDLEVRQTRRPRARSRAPARGTRAWCRARPPPRAGSARGNGRATRDRAASSRTRGRSSAASSEPSSGAGAHLVQEPRLVELGQRAAVGAAGSGERRARSKAASCRRTIPASRSAVNAACASSNATAWWQVSKHTPRWLSIASRLAPASRAARGSGSEKNSTASAVRSSKQPGSGSRQTRIERPVRSRSRASSTAIRHRRSRRALGEVRTPPRRGARAARSRSCLLRRPPAAARPEARRARAGSARVPVVPRSGW